MSAKTFGALKLSGALPASQSAHKGVSALEHLRASSLPTLTAELPPEIEEPIQPLFEDIEETYQPTSTQSPKATTTPKKSSDFLTYAQSVIPSLSKVEVLAIKTALDHHHPDTTLNTMDPQSELMKQYRRIEGLQIDTFGDPNVPANQKAAVSNSVASVLAQIVKMQTELHNTQRFKKMEAILIRLIKRLPKDYAEQFLADYAKLGGQEDL